MPKRWLASLGVSLLSLVFGTGVALADSAPAAEDSGQNTQVSEQSTTTVSSSDSAVIQTSSTSSQTVGDSTSDNGPVVTPQTSNSTDPASAPAPLITAQPLIPVVSDAPSTAAPAAVADKTSPTAIPEATVATIVMQAVQATGPDNSAPVLNAAAPVVPHNSNNNNPVPPQTPAGILDQLSAILSNTVVPGLLLGGTSLPMASTAALVILLALTATAARALLPVNLYTFRLRRSGFLGAARSDVGLLNLFATPHDMGFMKGALVPV